MKTSTRLYSLVATSVVLYTLTCLFSINCEPCDGMVVINVGRRQMSDPIQASTAGWLRRLLIWRKLHSATIAIA